MPLQLSQSATLTSRPAGRPGLFSFINKAAATLFLVGSGDFLLRDNGYAGWPLGLACLLLLATVVIINRGALRQPSDLVTLFVAASMALVQVYAPDPLALALFWSAVTLLALRQHIGSDGLLLLRRIAWHSATGWTQVMFDVLPLSRSWVRWAAKRQDRSLVRTAILPFFGALAFLSLFASANPLVSRMLEAINPWQLLSISAVERLFWWSIMATLAWSLLRARIGRLRHFAPLSASLQRISPLLLTDGSIFVSLILFNGIFATQNLLDIVFLWSGAKLPDGMTRVDYVHRGAYSLIATALLSAVIVLLIYRDGLQRTPSKATRQLIYLWIGQNIFLIASSAERLLDYIDAYALTLWRLSSLVWMALVALGFVLIAIRIAQGRSSIWLVNSNLAATAIVLYGSAMTDMGAAVADYNVRHNALVTERGAMLDMSYLCALGPSALPAIDWLYRNVAVTRDIEAVGRLRASLVAQVKDATADWRSWTLRDHLNLWRVERAPAAAFPFSNAVDKADRLQVAAARQALPPAEVTPYGAANTIVTRSGKPD